MSLSVLPSALLIPPLNLLPLGLAGLLASLRWPRLGRAVMGIAIVGLFVFSMPAVSGLLMVSLEVGLPRTIPPPDGHPPSAIVILSGNAAHGDRFGGITPGTGIGDLTLQRMYAGAQLHHRFDLPVLVTGGPLEFNAPPIAALMARDLQDELDTPVQWIELRADDTWENAEFSAAMLHHDGIDRAYIVTHPWHMRRALMAFSHFGIDAIPAPPNFDRMPGFNLQDFVPHVGALADSYFAMHEWIGCAYYAIRR